MTYQEKLLEVSPFKAWFIVVIASLFFFFEFGLTSVFNTLGQNIASEYHISLVHLGFINSLYFYSNILFLIPAGLILDRFSVKTAMICALFFCCVGIVAISFSDSIVVLMVARLIMGFAGSFSLISGIRIATNYMRAEKLGFAIGIVIAIGMLGGYAVQEPLTLIMEAYGWRHALLIVAISGFIVMFLVALFVRSAPRQLRGLRQEQCQSQKESPVWVAIKQVIRVPQNWYAAFYIGLINVATFMLGGAWADAYLMNTYHGVSQVEASSVSGFLFIGMMMAYPCWGKFSELLGRRKLPLLLGAIASLIIALLIMYVHGSLVWLSFLFFMLGFSTSAQTVAYPVIGEINSLKVNSTAMAIGSGMSLLFGGVLAQPLFPAMMHWYQHFVPASTVASQYQFAFSILIVTCFATLVFGFLVKETYCKRQVD